MNYEIDISFKRKEEKQEIMVELVHTNHGDEAVGANTST
jgi:hypothetical protein